MTNHSNAMSSRRLDQRNLRRLSSKTWFHLLSLTVITVLTYWGLWRRYFFTDDYWMLGWVRFADNLWDGLLAEIRLGYAVRPLMDAQLWIRSQLFGLDAAPYYWIALGQHLLVVGLVYWLALLLGFNRRIAWLSALLFGTSIAGYSVVHWITGSNYSMLCIPGLLGLCLFVLYRQSNRRGLLLTSVVCLVAAIFTNEAFISILALPLAYDLFVSLPGMSNRQKLRKLLEHAAYWVWLVPYFYLQMQFRSQDASQYTALGFGFHIVNNYGYLVHMVIPDISGSTVLGLLNDRLFLGWYDWYVGMSRLLAGAFVAIAAYLLWRGSRVQRFLVCWILVSYLPFMLWPQETGFASADRYRYVPSIAFSILLASGIGGWWVHPRLTKWKLNKAAPVFVVGLLIFNLAFHQLFIRQEIRVGEIKRHAVEAIQRLDPPPIGAHLAIEIPTAYFRDLGDVCSLLYSYPVTCVTFLPDENPSLDESTVHRWIKVSDGSIAVGYDRP